MDWREQGQSMLWRCGSKITKNDWAWYESSNCKLVNPKSIVCFTISGDWCALKVAWVAYGPCRAPCANVSILFGESYRQSNKNETDRPGEVHFLSIRHWAMGMDGSGGGFFSLMHFKITGGGTTSTSTQRLRENKNITVNLKRIFLEPELKLTIPRIHRICSAVANLQHGSHSFSPVAWFSPHLSP